MIYLANISAIEPLKGIDILIKAVAQLKREGTEVSLLHIGGLRNNTEKEQQYAQSLRQLATDEGVEQQIVWLGKRFDVPDVLRAADIYVHPSREEGLGVVLLEAAVEELPLIGSKVGGIPEVVEDGVNGILFDNESIEQLALAIKTLVLNHSLRAQYATAARETAYAHFDMNRQTDRLVDTYLCA